MGTAGKNVEADAPLAAVTGASGFIGRRLVPALVQAGWRVRVLMRRDPVLPEWRQLVPQVVAGDLRDGRALERLIEGASAVIHVAGTIKAARRAEYLAINRDATAQLAEALMRVSPDAHLLHLSSLAARHPELSDYAASKRAGEEAVRSIAPGRATVLRPPAVYGPGDRETLVFFQLAQRARIPLVGAPQARAAMIHVDDLIATIVALAGGAPHSQVLGISDGQPAGYSWRQVFAAAARAVGNREPHLFQAPGALLRAVALGGDVARLFGTANMLTSQKLKELLHEDWSLSEAERCELPAFAPRYTLESGFAHTVAWYRAAGWLRAG